MREEGIIGEGRKGEEKGREETEGDRKARKGRKERGKKGKGRGWTTLPRF